MGNAIVVAEHDRRALLDNQKGVCKLHASLVHRCSLTGGAEGFSRHGLKHHSRFAGSFDTPAEHARERIEAWEQQDNKQNCNSHKYPLSNGRR
jgi:hypothetical protein